MTERRNPPEPRAYAPPAGHGRIVHVDEDCLVADKPAGLLCVPGRGAARQDCLATRLEAVHGPPEIVHRLDMDTSGLVVFARSKNAARILSSAFERRAVRKRYTARVEGLPEGGTGEIALTIGRDWEARPRRRVDHDGGKPALTRWRVIAGAASSSLVDLEPVTGRTHQLRVHLAAIGHPILGDPLYGPAGQAGRLCLHARELGFAHPQSGLWMAFESHESFGKTDTVHK